MQRQKVFKRRKKPFGGSQQAPKSEEKGVIPVYEEGESQHFFIAGVVRGGKGQTARR